LEGFGFTTLEACLLNKIVIASNAGSIPEVISGKHILIEPGSTVAIVKGCIQAYNGVI
jgi:glycosyltransferase involved in cell wall biosynthesis